MRFLSDNVVKLHFRQLNYSTANMLGKLSLNWKNEFLDIHGAIFHFLVFIPRQELHFHVNNTFWYFWKGKAERMLYATRWLSSSKSILILRIWKNTSLLCKFLEVGLDGIGLMFKDHEKLHRRYLVLVLLEMKRIIRIVMLRMVIVVMMM